LKEKEKKLLKGGKSEVQVDEQRSGGQVKEGEDVRRREQRVPLVTRRVD